MSETIRRKVLKMVERITYNEVKKNNSDVLFCISILHQPKKPPKIKL